MLANKSFKFLAVQEPNFLEPKFCQNRPLTGFCMYIGPASVFVLFLDLTSGLCRAVFPMFLVSPIGLQPINRHIDRYTFCVEVFEKTVSRKELIDHSFESKFYGACYRLCKTVCTVSVARHVRTNF